MSSIGAESEIEQGVNHGRGVHCPLHDGNVGLAQRQELGQRQQRSKFPVGQHVVDIEQFKWCTGSFKDEDEEESDQREPEVRGAETMGINIRKPMVVYEDNRSTLKIATNATALKRTKYIDIRHHFLREHVEQGTITIRPIATAEQRADIMTKILGKQLFLRFRDMITSDIDLTAVDKRTCAKCAQVFPTRNKLFKHLKCCVC